LSICNERHTSGGDALGALIVHGPGQVRRDRHSSRAELEREMHMARAKMERMCTSKGRCLVLG
jgi:hypothetical protein